MLGLGAQFLQEIEARDAGHHPVEDDEVHGMAAEYLAGLGHGPGYEEFQRNLAGKLAQHVVVEFLHVRVVFDDEDSLQGHGAFDETI